MCLDPSGRLEMSFAIVDSRAIGGRPAQAMKIRKRCVKVRTAPDRVVLDQRQDGIDYSHYSEVDGYRCFVLHYDLLFVLFCTL